MVSPATRKHRAKVFSVIETNKIVKKGLENVTRNISNSVFDVVQFPVIVVTIGVKDLVPLSSRGTICHWKNDDLPSQQRFSRLYSFKESINFLSIFPPSYSLFFFSRYLFHTHDSEYIPDLKLFYDAYWSSLHRAFSAPRSIIRAPILLEF